MVFGLPAGTTPVHWWNATIEPSGDRYVATGAGWNTTLAAGDSTTFGWLASGTGAPTSCELNGGPCSGSVIGPLGDIQPPKAPSVTVLQSGGLIQLSWVKPWDDTGVVSYEVYAGDGLLGATSEPKFTTPLPPMVGSDMLKVRALDAAGNASAFGAAVLGAWPTGPAAQPPTAVTTQRVPDGLLVSWQPAAGGQYVLGYEVTVNGSSYTETGRTSMTVPPPAVGVGTVSVRARSVIGNSVPTSIKVDFQAGTDRDVQPPTAPSGFRVGYSVGPTLDWTPSSDNVGVAGYEVEVPAGGWYVFRGTSVLLPPIPLPDCGMTVPVRVRAFDAAGNRSTLVSVPIFTAVPPTAISIVPPAPGGATSVVAGSVATTQSSPRAGC